MSWCVLILQRLLYLSTLALLLTGCSRWPEWYPAPAQRKPILKRSLIMIPMDDRDIEDYIVKDIAPAIKGVYWRWGYERPELAIPVKDATNRRVAMDFGVIAETLKTTGPVTVTLFVNGHEAVARRYTQAGDYHLEAPIPERWITGQAAAHLTVEARPVFTSKDGQRLSILLVRAGFL